ncbi:MAG: hypothetical protein ACOYNC_16230 [Bacteroidales bacterium]
MIQYFDTTTNQTFIDVSTLMGILKKNKAETHRLIELFKIQKVTYKNRYLLDFIAVEHIISGLSPKE